jgi:23S rRNA pseudouridine1911/1915/1917 synthase
VTTAEAGSRLDRFLAVGLEAPTRSQIKHWIEEGRVLVEGSAVKAGYRLRAGETVDVDVPPPPAIRPGPEAIPLRVLFEDESLAVIDKPAGLAVHPGAGRRMGTLVNALLGRGMPLSGMGAPDRPGIVHRLDKGTSGLLVVAKTDAAHRELSRALAAREVGRRYVALVWGAPRDEAGCIIGPLARSRADRRRMRVVTQGGREAITRYRVIWKGTPASAVVLALETGRTHQIRAHFLHVGHPVFGDPEYGGRPADRCKGRAPGAQAARRALAVLSRQALHAAGLSLRHPITGRELVFESEVPGDMRQAADLLGLPAAIRDTAWKEVP